MDVKLIGEGGAMWEFDLPLSEPFADQVKAGRLRPADDDSRDALAALLDDGGDAAQSDAPPARELTLAERIDALTSHADANALAAELNVEGFEDKKPALDAKRTALHEAAAAAAAAAA